jgi:hypothetical protein
MVERFEPQLGKSWAYRARQVDDVVAIEVMKLGTQRPARVLPGEFSRDASRTTDRY